MGKFDMIKLKSLLMENEEMERNARSFRFNRGYRPSMEYIFDNIPRIAKECGIDDISKLSKEKERETIEGAIKMFIPFSTVRFNSFEEYLKVIQKIVDEWFMRKYIKSKSTLTEETGFFQKYFFCGDCRTILDSGQLFGDATEMAQAIENSTPLTKLEFIDKIIENSIPKKYKLFRVMLSRNPDDFEFGEGNRFIFAYDSISDIHYFFML